MIAVPLGGDRQIGRDTSASDAPRHRTVACGVSSDASHRVGKPRFDVTLAPSAIRGARFNVRMLPRETRTIRGQHARASAS